MKSCILLIIALSMATMALADDTNTTCSGNGRMVRQFNGRKEDTKMPCKYNAVHQKCGSYIVTLTPGNIYLHPKYRLDSLWLGIKDENRILLWGGRTDNKIAVKYFNGWKNELFNKKEGDMNTTEILEFNKNSEETWAEAKNGDFRVTFVPWDPECTNFNMSQWKFQCFASNFTPSGYPDQICGGEDEREVAERRNELKLEGRDQVVYYDVLTNINIIQTNPKCQEATSLMTKNCTKEQRRLAIITCSQILSSTAHTKCVTKYSCDPMDVFLDCIEWVCSDFTKNEACEKVGRAIDMCRKFPGGDLTQKVKNQNCYKEFLNISCFEP